ncbi:MAG: ADP-forming succinate--CoA ligase subunit beta [Candidatus Mcinerneyibacterium aminivorans]|uniref:Succinate--CoA ligase [ADP-forming] subunit beta n=1 Tax=Candidatus Mcinerneyibacterium aminivorans TaxID=2703815 RepID=A0A5D0MER0_9BACT|nr:MAG: ADP-forming succinate--CoA ligase subunit beta [Candidatus Mcinerneyibacterium aminivorans]
MKLMEYQAKKVFAENGIETPEGFLIEKKEDLEESFKKLNEKAVLKAQVLAGGRGKAGGVKLVNSLQEAEEMAENLLGNRLVTHQTDSNGEKVNSLLMEEQIDINKEIYFSILNDREKQKNIFIISAEGGTEIEELAKNNPQAIKKIRVDQDVGLKEYHVRQMFLQLEMDKKYYSSFFKLISKLYNLYLAKDASLIEINPLVVTGENEFIALDAKVKIDDNALFRQKELEEIRIIPDDEKDEVEAKEKGLSFVELDGDVGCMVNGAGLAMATMDIIKHYDMEPANFLDIGGSSDPQKVINALEYITQNENLRAIFINVFGGITRCDDVANGFKKALEKIDVNVPIVIRLTGTNEKEGKEILKKLGHDVFTDLKEAVLKLKQVYSKSDK